MQLLSVSSVLQTIGSILVALLILLAMITIHEFGHYAAGKLLKFKITEFAIGFGPALCKRRNRKTGELFSVRALPLGGYCAFDGEDEESDSEGSFLKQKPWKRILVLFAGAFMNYVLAMVLILVSFFANGQYLMVAYEVAPSDTVYSFQARDIILSCEGKNVYLTADLIRAVSGGKAGDLVPFRVSRETEHGREILDIEVMLRTDATEMNLSSTDALWTALGIAKDDAGQWQVYVTAVRFGFFRTIGRAFVYSFRIAGSIFQALGELLTGALGLKAMGGPITTIKLTSQIATRSWQSFLEIASYIGVNLAVFNLLPIPALDGSKIVFTAIEWIRGKPVNRKVEAIIHTVGFILILGFAILVDLLQFL